MDLLQIDKEEGTYTKQLCEKCGKEVFMGFGFALMNLDKKVLCEDCRRKE